MKRGKRIFVIEQGTGRLANQLWNYTSVYAYCLERGYDLYNAAFTDYEDLFQFPKESVLTRILLMKPFRKNKLFIKIRAYRWYLKAVDLIFKSRTIVSVNARAFYLPPSPNVDEAQEQSIQGLETSKKDFFFRGWMFRNPVGLQKYHEKICEYFKPKLETLEAVETVLSKARAISKHVVGVHIRQGDYRTIEKDFYFSPAAVKDILFGYLKAASLSPDQAAFVIASDEPIDQGIFKGLRVILANGTPLADLMTLAGTDIVIGADSTYGAFAAYYGNIPFIVFERLEMDWSAIHERGYNFENRSKRLHS
jgi:hypothetical protein